MAKTPTIWLRTNLDKKKPKNVIFVKGLVVSDHQKHPLRKVFTSS